MDYLGDRGIREHISSEVAARFVTSPEICQPNCSCPNQRWQENEFILKYKGLRPFPGGEHHSFPIFGGSCGLMGSSFPFPFLPSPSIVSFFPPRLELKTGPARGNAPFPMQ